MIGRKTDRRKERKLEGKNERWKERKIERERDF